MEDRLEGARAGSSVSSFIVVSRRLSGRDSFERWIAIQRSSLGLKTNCSWCLADSWKCGVHMLVGTDVTLTEVRRGRRTQVIPAPIYPCGGGACESRYPTYSAKAHHSSAQADASATGSRKTLRTLTWHQLA